MATETSSICSVTNNLLNNSNTSNCNSLVMVKTNNATPMLLTSSPESSPMIISNTSGSASLHSITNKNLNLLSATSSSSSTSTNNTLLRNSNTINNYNTCNNNDTDVRMHSSSSGSSIGGEIVAGPGQDTLPGYFTGNPVTTTSRCINNNNNTMVITDKKPPSLQQATAPAMQGASEHESSRAQAGGSKLPLQAQQAASQGSSSPTPIQQPAPPMKESKYVDIYREKPIRVIVKVLVPVREHPKFNFVGKLLGPKGNSMKRLQEETMTKMAVLGRGSMRDKQKEEELRASLDPKYCHLSEELHVEITAYAPPAEAHARIAYALAEVRKYLIPDSNDEIRQEQMREMELLQNNTGDASPNGAGSASSSPGGGSAGGNGTATVVPSPAVASAGTLPGGRRPPPLGMRGARGGRGGLPPPPPMLRGHLPGRGGRGGLLAPPPPPAGGRGGHHALRKAPLPPPSAAMLSRPTPKQKVMSILDRARVAMEESYSYEEECYYDAYDAYDSVGYGGYEEYEDSLGDYYDPPEGYTEAAAGGPWKSFKAPSSHGAGGAGGGGPLDRARFRAVPYARPK